MAVSQLVVGPFVSSKQRQPFADCLEKLPFAFPPNTGYEHGCSAIRKTERRFLAKPDIQLHDRE